MSGGSLGYGYSKLLYIKEDLEELLSKSVEDGEEIDKELYEKFINHLGVVADALRAIEWVHSGDCSYPHENEFILKVFENISK